MITALIILGPILLVGGIAALGITALNAEEARLTQSTDDLRNAVTIVRRR